MREGNGPVIRDACNPLLTIGDVRPHSDDYEVIGVFNPGVTVKDGKVLLLLRVAERMRDRGDNILRVPRFSAARGCVETLEFDRSDPDCDFLDCRVVKRRNGEKYLTSMSYFLPATSEDGTHFTIDYDRMILPSNMYEAYGIEDARIVRIGQRYYINYSAASDKGIVTSLISTEDFRRYRSEGNILPPDNKDVALLPERIGAYYYCMHRPSTSEYGRPEIWCAKSRDLCCWGGHEWVMGTRPGKWDSVRVGSSSVPMRTPYGWLMLYHGANERNEYCLGAVLLDADNPARVIARTDEPLLRPEAPYEKNGFFSDVVFACGCVEYPDRLDVYYGAADQCVCRASLSKAHVFGALGLSVPVGGQSYAVQKPVRTV